MHRLLSKTVLAGVAALMAASFVSAQAYAQPQVQFGVTIGGAEVLPVQYWGDGGDRYAPPPPPPPRGWGPPPRDHWGPPGPPPPRGPGFCPPPGAMDRAFEAGLHHPRIERVTPRRIIVGGWRRGGYDRIILANRPGCPYIG
ncbi:hypothetical protein NAC44_17675 [Allorhizobium sp. BGMRC 0089]|uniref:hypothetical protein n=1 Tax=Allorhizobium sonneratiae TaxID=2934936 RepID=UPI00203350C4|nr:hypothetical protein [Allorhizobium sonneratiae]MCM2294159.1 hypothetical protein [Allorhizobium sonneratiae]